MKQIIIIGLAIIVGLVINQLNDFELFLINQTSMNACMIDVDCD